jgi:kynurenine formamidase
VPAKSRPRLSEKTEWPDGFGNWGRWRNERGTLNLITPQKVLDALETAQTGDVYPCALPLHAESYPKELQDLYGIDATGYTYEMFPLRPGALAANDKISLSIHRREHAHIDALSHVGHRGYGFDGIPFEEIVASEGAKRFDVTQMLGIVTRGILVDVPRNRGVQYLEPGDAVTEEDLVAGAPGAEAADAIFIRTANLLAQKAATATDVAVKDPHGPSAGMHLDAMQFIADRDIAVLGTDSTGDTYPMPFPEQPSIHAVCEVYLGLPLLHGLALEELAAECAVRNRNEFLLVIASLNIPGGTGSPVTPLAIL